MSLEIKKCGSTEMIPIYSFKNKLKNKAIKISASLASCHSCRVACHCEALAQMLAQNPSGTMEKASATSANDGAVMVSKALAQSPLFLQLRSACSTSSISSPRERQGLTWDMKLQVLKMLGSVKSMQGGSLSHWFQTKGVWQVQKKTCARKICKTSVSVYFPRKVNMFHRNWYQRGHVNHGELKDSTFQQGVVNQREPNLAKTHCQELWWVR